jgi:hypothetical protein
MFRRSLHTLRMPGRGNGERALSIAHKLSFSAAAIGDRFLSFITFTPSPPRSSRRGFSFAARHDQFHCGKIAA